MPAEATDESSSTLVPEEKNLEASAVEGEKHIAADFEPRTGQMQPRRIRQPQQIRSAKNLKQIEKVLQPSQIFADSHWNLWQGVRAVAASDVQGAPDVYVANISGFYLVEDREYQAQENLAGQEEPLIYYNRRTQQAGIVTGTLKITLRRSGAIESLSSRHKLKVEGAFPHLNLYMVRSNHEPVDLHMLQKQLLADADIAQVEVEILSRQYEKN